MENDAELQQKIANERLEYILEGAGLGAWDWWLKTNQVEFDRRWCQMLGLDVRETPMELSTWESRVHPEDKEKCQHDIQAYLRGETEVYENIHRLRHADGRWVWIVDRGRIAERDADGNPVRFVGTHLDITKLKESEHINRALQASAKIGGWELDVKTGQTSWTEEVYEIYGIPSSTPTDKIQGISYYAELDQARITRDVEACIGGKDFRGVYALTDANGIAKQVEAYGQAVRDSHGRVYKLLGTFQDVSKREAAQREKTELLKTLELAVDGANLGVWNWDLTTNQVFYNAKWAELRGLQQSDLKMTIDDWKATTHPDDVTVALGKIDDYLNGRAPYYECEFRVKHTNGEWRTIIGRAKSSSWGADGKPNRISGTDFDITALKQAQERLKVESKLASLGLLSAGMAHEINNPLAIIMSALESLSRLSGSSEKVLTRIDTIRRAGKRIEKIVRSLHRFSRSSGKKQRTVCDLRDIVTESLDMLDAKAKRASVPITVDLGTEAPINCDRIEIEQVLLNVIGNAIDAVKKLPNPWVKVTLDSKDDEVVVQVLDSGPGVPIHLEAKIYDPFFTTKDVGEGTGLGLSISKGIIDSHEATIRINRQVANSCFEIRFKRSSDGKVEGSAA